MSYAMRERPGAGWRQGEGWLLFAAIILITAGVMRVLDAFWAFARDDDLSQPMQTLFFDDSLTAYGWLWLTVGVLLIAAGFGVLSGAEWARWFGIGMAAVAAVSAMLWMYDFPIWSLFSGMIAVLVIYALATYGGRAGVDRAV